MKRPFFFLYLLFFFSISINGYGFSHIELIGKKIVELDIKCDTPFERKPVNHAIVSRPGMEYDPELIRQSIQLIHYLDLYEDIQVDAELLPEGVKLTYLLKMKSFVRRLDLDGGYMLLPFFPFKRTGISRKEILRGIKVQKDDEFSANNLQASIDHIQKLFEKYGYPHCKVLPTVEENPITKEVDVRLKIEPGPPLVVSEIKFEGEFKFSEKKILSKMNTKKGKPLNMHKLEKDILRVPPKLSRLYPGPVQYFKTLFTREGSFRKIEMALKSLEKDTEKNEAKLTLEIKDGQKVISRLNSKWHFWMLKDNPIDEITALKVRKLNTDYLIESVQNLKDLYEKHSYYQPDIYYETSYDKKGRLHLNFFVKEEKKIRIKEITISGNKLMGTHTINKQILSGSKGHRFFNRDTLESDIKAIKNLYQSNGFLDTEINSPRVIFSEDLKYAFIGIDIKEGIQTRVEDVKIISDVVLTLKKTIKPKVKAGQVFFPPFCEEDEAMIYSKYALSGYRDAIVRTKLEFNEDRSKVVVNYIVEAGPRYYIGNIIIRGFKLTQRKIIFRELLFKEGEPYDLEKILKSQQKLYQLGIFQSVIIEPAPMRRASNIVDIIVTVREKTPGAVEFGVGYNSAEEFKSFVSVLDQNFFGFDRTIGTSLFYSTRENKAEFFFHEPWLFNNPFDSGFSIYYSEIDREGYDLRKTGSSLNVTKTFLNYMKWISEYRYEDVNYFNVDKSFTGLSQEELTRKRLSSITQSFIYDTRRNPLNPYKGLLFGISFQQGDRLIGSQVDFTKFGSSIAYYTPWKYKHIIASSLKVGIGHNLPVQERYFVGGYSTVRGFTEKEIGPVEYKTDDQGKTISIPVGGDAMFIFNLELRNSHGSSFGSALFYDYGTAWQSLKQWDFDDLRQSAGIGFFWLTPVGPLRFDYAFKINRWSELTKGEWYFSFGHPF